MKTDDFIRTLAADRAVAIRPNQALALALAAGVAVAAAVFTLTLGLRSDVGAALQTVRFLFKFVVTIAVFAAGLRLAAALARPGGDAASAARLLLVPVALMGAALAIELVVVPADAWMPRLIGYNAAVCLGAIP
ncbi:MAG: NrsF family protein, partial [Rhodoplanes sp.]